VILELLAWIALALSLVPAALYVWNSFLFRRSTELRLLTQPARQVSVLIPARNEEQSIAACVRAVLGSRQAELEVIVLDDQSEDRTAEVVRAIADPRVRVESAPPLPPGWNGKQHASFVLSNLAKHPLLAFIDADVRLEPDALARMIQFLEESKAGIASGFPRQETGTFLEKLLLPLINWVLLSYLPMIGMRQTRWPMFAAGCGQFFICTREAYEKSGGHAAIRDSMHDGVTLPRAFRRAGVHTDVCDASDLATCRMYRSNRATWNGLAKNAHEGLGSATSIIPWTVLLVGGLVFPFWIFVRMSGAMRYRESLLSAILHPLGIVMLIAIQWYALIRRTTGRPVGWKGRVRSPPVTTGDLHRLHTSSSSTMA
jgi:glycosyltransferase involved in cell wall biosynthesis